MSKRIYKGGIPKLKWGEDLAPDHQPTGTPQYLTSGMPVIGNEYRPDRDNLATVIAKRSKDTPPAIPAGDWAPDRVVLDGTVVVMEYEDRYGKITERLDRTTELGDAPLPGAGAFTGCERRDWSSYDEAIESARLALLALGIDYTPEPPKIKADDTKPASYACTKRDFMRFAARALNRQCWTLPLDPAKRAAERARILDIYLEDFR